MAPVNSKQGNRNTLKWVEMDGTDTRTHKADEAGSHVASSPDATNIQLVRLRIVFAQEAEPTNVSRRKDNQIRSSASGDCLSMLFSLAIWEGDRAVT